MEMTKKIEELKNKDWRERRDIAADPQTPAEILEALADDECSIVRRAVATNPNTPVEILTKLARDIDIFVHTSAYCRLENFNKK